jgi:hypothetical protein
MKKVLSLLVLFVFLQTQSWALSGGPVFGTSSGVNVIGTFSGVMIPDSESGINVAINGGSNSIGIFSLGVPDAGIATGSFAFFGNAQAYNGTISGIADPDRATLKAILDAPSTLRTGSTTSTNGGTASSTFVGQAIGSMDAEIAPAISVFAATAARLIGTAHIDVFEGDFNADLSVNVASTFDFVVDGFKQSSTVAASSVSIGG